MHCLCLLEVLEGNIVPVWDFTWVLLLRFSSEVKHRGLANKHDIFTLKGPPTLNIGTDRCRFLLPTNHLGNLALGEGTSHSVKPSHGPASGFKVYRSLEESWFQSPENFLSHHSFHYEQSFRLCVKHHYYCCIFYFNLTYRFTACSKYFTRCLQLKYIVVSGQDVVLCIPMKNNKTVIFFTQVRSIRSNWCTNEIRYRKFILLWNFK